MHHDKRCKESNMKIVKAEVFVTCPRNFVTLKITTEDGITGLGDATPMDVSSWPLICRITFVRSLLVAMRNCIEDIWQFFIKVLTGVAVRLRCRPFQRLDMALWDTAKAANMLLYQLSAARLVKG